MTDGDGSRAQTTLSDGFGGGDTATEETEERPAGEAAHVAGNGGQGADVVDLSEERFPTVDDRVEFAVTQVDYTIEGYGDEEHPVLHVFGRTADRESVHVRVHGFRPYFYTPLEELEHETPEDGQVREGHIRDGRIVEEARLTGVETYGDLRAEGEDVDADRADDELVLHESIRGTDLVKVFGQTPRDVGQLREEFVHYEADILFPNRLLIDKDVTSGVSVPARETDDGENTYRAHHTEISTVEATAPLRVNTFDIEVDDRRGFPEDGEEPIVCLTSHDSYRDEYVAWLYTAPEGIEGPDDLGDYEPIGESVDVTVRRFESEAAMLDAFVEYMDETDPDVLTGWNCLPGDSEVQMTDGTTREIRDVQIGDEVVGSEDQRSAVAEVTNKWRSERAVLEFDLADGTSLRSSADHRVMVGDDDAVDWKRGGDVEPGDYVLKPREYPVADPRVPRLADLVPTELQRFPDEELVKEFKSELPRGTIPELAEAWDVSPGTLYHPHVNVWKVDRCERISDDLGVPLPDGGRVYRQTGAELDRRLTERELYLAGLILTDGTMSKESGIRFYNTREELHAQFPGNGTLQPDGKGCYKQNVLDYATMYAFRGLGIPFGDKNAAEVDLSPVFRMPRDYIGRFLAGAIDGDGHVSSSVTVAARNHSIGDWYVRLFRRLGIYAERNEDVVRVSGSPRNTDRLKEWVLPWMNHPEKVRRLRELEGRTSGRTENVPYALFEAETGTDAKRIGRDKHRRGINLKRHETDSEEWREYVFVRVEGVTETGTETTYDIETTTGDFVAEDCLVHNCDDFDAPYLIDRIDRLVDRGDAPESLYSDRLSRIDEVWDSGWGGPNIKGRVVFDLLYAYKRTQFTELDSYRLDAVGETELGIGKERYPGDIGDLWEQDPKRLAEYNLRDVELCVEIDRKQEVIPFWEEVASFVGCKLEDATTPGDAVDLYILHKVHGEFALPSKGTVDSEEYAGGAVFDPITGIRENVTVLDLASLYPMCMVTVNASPETKVDPETYAGETFRAPNGTHFRKEPDGIIREMVDELLSEREQKKALRNEHEPGAPEYEQYDRQQGAVKVIMNCFTPDTDVLTPDGVRNIRDLDVGDEVYSLDPETMRMEVKPVIETHEYLDYRGDLVDIETSKVDFRVTPNHRMLVRKDDKNGASWDDFRFVEAGELTESSHYELPHDWDGPDGERIDEVDLIELVESDYEVWVRPSVHGHTFTAELGWTPRRVPKADLGQTGYVFTSEEFERHREYIERVCETSYVHRESGRKWIPRTYDGDDFLDLLAWYITEGSVYTSEDKQFGENYRGSATTIKLAQNAVADGGRSDDHTDIRELLDRMEFDYYVDDRSYQFTSKLLGETLERLCGENSFQKRIPEFVFEASREQKRRFLDTLVAGDGDRQVNSWRYTTSSERLRDDVLELCAHLGLSASYNHDSGSWRIYCTEGGKNSFRMHRSGSRSTAEDGVYCVTVDDNHTLMAGRNGKFQFVGQSLYGVLGWDRFRLYDKEMGAAVTATGREVIEHTQSAAREVGYEVAYGDTDSVMLEIGDISLDDVEGDVAVTDEMREAHPEMGEAELEGIAASISKGFELEEQINGSYDEFALERLGAEHHRFKIEFEKLYRRFFQAGKKKRYAGHIVWKEGKDVDDIDITGFEYKRSDIAPITKEVQKTVLEMIVTQGDVEGVTEYVNEVIEDFQAGNVSIDDVGIPGGIGKRLDNYDTDTAHVRGAKYANLLLGTNFGRGSKPKRLYLKRVHSDFFERIEAERGLDPAEDPLYGEFRRDPDVICFEFADQIPEEFEVDWEKMLDKTLKGPIARVLEALDVSWEEVKSGQEQTGLGQFM
jgi:DNA polymerase I